MKTRVATSRQGGRRPRWRGLAPGLLAVMLSTGAWEALAQVPRQGVGPFDLTVGGETYKAKLVRRDSSMVWIMRQMQSGEFIKTAVPLEDVSAVSFPRPKAFDAGERARTEEQIDRVLAALRRFVRMMKAFRDLPGASVDEALYLQGRLQERKGNRRLALGHYRDILEQDYETGFGAEARFRAGLCLAALGQHREALGFLEQGPAPEDDLALLSEIALARGDAYRALEQYEQAVLTYLHLLVFHPYVQDNERTCLGRVLPCYAALEDWEALLRTYKALKAQYPDSEEAARADELIETYREEMEAERLYAGVGGTAPADASAGQSE